MKLKPLKANALIVSHEVERLEQEYNEALKSDAPLSTLKKLKDRLRRFKKEKK